MDVPTDQDLVRELRARAEAGAPPMSLDATAVRAAGRRGLVLRRWGAGAGTVAAAVVLAVVVMTPGWLHLREGVGPVGGTSATPCLTAPTAEYVAPGVPATSLSGGATVTVAANVGEPVTVRFVGDCAAGGRLMINGAEPDEVSDYIGLWSGQIAGNWTPTEPGTRTLLAAWACTGPMSCPLTTLGFIRVVTEDPRPLEPLPSFPSEATPEEPSAESPDLQALAPGEWQLAVDANVADAGGALASAFVTFALDPSVVPDGLTFAQTVGLGAGGTIERFVPARQLNDLAAWDVAAAGGYERDGPFNALTILAAWIDGTDDNGINGGQLAVRLGEHPGCPYVGVDVPAEYADATEIWISPAGGAIDSCLDWFAVDLFVDGGMVRAVTVQLGSP